MTEKVLIAGNGECAAHTAMTLAESGVEAVLAFRDDTLSEDVQQQIASRDRGKLKVMAGVAITRCLGCVNEFSVSLQSKTDTRKERFNGIVLAEAFTRRDNLSAYGLQPSDTVMPLSALTRMVQKEESHALLAKQAQELVFLAGCRTESNPRIMREIMTLAVMLQQDYGKKVVILTGNLKVGGDGLEALYRRSREAGVVYLKVNRSQPEVESGGDGKVTIICQDEILQESVKLSPDWIIVDESIQPGDYLTKLVDLFELNADAAGFVQTGNVHREPVYTNRKGIFAAGPARGVFEKGAQLADAGSAAAAFLKMLKEPGADASRGTARIGVVECARCITCYRICPYRAIRLEDRVTFYPDACEGCGICVAECPREYIQWEGTGAADDLEQIRLQPASGKDGTFEPNIIVFGCMRSACRAIAAARQGAADKLDGVRMVEVPCGGGIAVDHMLQAFMKGADGVLILTCHTGNCHAEVGNRYAENRFQQVAVSLARMGFEKERFQLRTIAANMEEEVTRIITTFTDQVRQIGPSPMSRKGKTR